VPRSCIKIQREEAREHRIKNKIKGRNSANFNLRQYILEKEKVKILQLNNIITFFYSVMPKYLSPN